MARIPRLPTMAVLLLAAATTVTTNAASPAAGASCVGPMLLVPSATIAAPLDRGQSFVVTGRAWGDNCYDTGVPPGGRGVLGNPLRNISIVFVQGDRRIVVARGAADPDYGFRVRVTVPEALEPGSVRLVAHHGSQDVEAASSRGTYSPPQDGPTAITLSTAAPTGRPLDVARFGPSAGAAARTPASSEPDHPATVSYSLVLLAVIGGVGLTAGLIGALARRRRA